jgi:hypothetical protein
MSEGLVGNIYIGQYTLAESLRWQFDVGREVWVMAALELGVVS